MIDPEMLRYLTQAHINDLLREAERERVANSVRDGDPCPALLRRVARPRLSWPTLTLRLARLRRNVAL